MAIAIVAEYQGTLSAGTQLYGTFTTGTSGELALAMHRWYGTQTISGITFTSETAPTLYGSPQGGGPVNGTSQAGSRQIASSGSNKVWDATLSAAPGTGGAWTGYRLTGHDTTTPIFDVKGASGSGGTPSVSFTSVPANSAIFIIGTSDDSSLGVDTGSGYTNDTNISDSYYYDFGGYKLDIGSGGSVTVNLTATSGTWSFIAVVIAPVATGGPFTVTQQGTMALAGTLTMAGQAVSTVPFTVTQQGTMALAGSMTAAAALSMATSFSVAGGTIPLAGSLTLAGALTFTPRFNVEQVGSIGLVGSLTTDGQLSIVVPWEPSTPIEITTMLGTMTLVGDLVYASAAFSIVQQSPIAMAGALTLQGALATVPRFNVEQQGSLALSGALTLAGDLSVGRSVSLVPLAPISLSGSLATSGDLLIQTGAMFIVEAAPIALGGSLTLAGDLAYLQPVVFSVVQQGTTSLAGSLSLAGDLSITHPIDFAVQAVAPISLAGTLGLAGGLQVVVPFQVQASTVSLAGSITIGGALQFGSPVDLAAVGPVALAGSLGLAGDLHLTIPTTVPDVAGLTQAAAEAEIAAARLVTVVVEAFSADVAVGTVISQDPAAGSGSFVGDSVTITVSSGSIANDPKLIAKRKKQPNVAFKTLRRKREEEKVSEAAPAPTPTPKPSPLVLGLVARGLTKPEPADAPAPAEPAPALDVASIVQAAVAEAVPLPGPSVAVEKPEAAPVAPPAAPTPVEELLTLVRSIEQQLREARAEFAQMRAPAAPSAFQPTARDPVHEALHAILPGLGDPIDLNAEPPAPRSAAPARQEPPPAPAKPAMTAEQRRAENKRRAEIAVKRLLKP